MPAKTERQHKLFGAELARRRKGQKPRLKASTKTVQKMARKRRA